MPEVRVGRGRPVFKPTPAMKRSVERMVACGDSQETIARALGIDDETLRKHFGEELKTGYAKRRRQVVDLLFEGAEKGNASLIKRVEEMTRLQGAAADFAQGDNVHVQAPTRVLRRGKKEMQQEEALTAGINSEWGDDLAPLAGTKPN